jgi:hypothetical protein
VSLRRSGVLFFASVTPADIHLTLLAKNPARRRGTPSLPLG